MFFVCFLPDMEHIKFSNLSRSNCLTGVDFDLRFYLQTWLPEKWLRIFSFTPYEISMSGNLYIFYAPLSKGEFRFRPFRGFVYRNYRPIRMHHFLDHSRDWIFPRGKPLPSRSLYAWQRCCVWGRARKRYNMEIEILRRDNTHFKLI